ncbi:hypothetical protein ACJW30_03G108000 [Castanea mollissima]
MPIGEKIYQQDQCHPPITNIMDLPCNCDYLDHIVNICSHQPIGIYTCIYEHLNHICRHQAIWIHTCIYDRLNRRDVFVVIIQQERVFRVTCISYEQFSWFDTF